MSHLLDVGNMSLSIPKAVSLANLQINPWTIVLNISVEYKVAE